MGTKNYVLPFVVVTILCLLICCSDDIIAIVPVNGYEIDYQDPRVIGDIENHIVKEYLENTVYDDDYTYTRVLDYCTEETDWDKSCPLPITITIDERIVQALNNEGIDSLIVKTYKDDCLFRQDILPLSYTVPVYNLIPGQEYYYTVSYKDDDNLLNKIVDGYLEASGIFRAIYVEGMHNFRDIGGYETMYGKRIRYDRLYRSAEPQRKSNPAQGDITPNGINELVNNLKIDVELDFGDVNAESPLQNYIEFVGDIEYHISYYDRALNPESSGFTGTQYKNCFELILENLRQNKKVLFHCNAGADRTGTLAFILEALLGVSESDLAKDYELTSFFEGNVRRRDVNYYSQTDYGYPSMISYIKTHFNGETINEKVENMMISFGVSSDQIEEFRQYMLEDTVETQTTTEIYKIQVGRKDGNSITNLPGIKFTKFQRGINIKGNRKIVIN